VGLKLNGTHQRLAYADDVNLLGDSTDTVKKNTDTSIINAGKEAGLEKKNKRKLNICPCLVTKIQGKIVT
jgi:hypothetical protein